MDSAKECQRQQAAKYLREEEQEEENPSQLSFGVQMRDHSELTLRRQKDFGRVYKKGKSRGGQFMVVLYKENGLEYTRTAFVASKKVGNSVQRNRARRLMRESCRSIRDFKPGYDIIFVARAGIADHNKDEVEKSMRNQVKSCGLV